MNFNFKSKRLLAVMLIFVMTMTLALPLTAMDASAKKKVKAKFYGNNATIVLGNTDGSSEAIPIYAGTSGKFVCTDISGLSDFKNYRNITFQEDPTFVSTNSSIMEVSKDGSYKAVTTGDVGLVMTASYTYEVEETVTGDNTSTTTTNTSTGVTTISDVEDTENTGEVNPTPSSEWVKKSATSTIPFNIHIYLDPNNISLEATEGSSYVFTQDQSKVSTIQVVFKGMEIGPFEKIEASGADWTRDGNVFTLSSFVSGEKDVEITINGKVFKFTWKVKEVKAKTTSFLLKKGKKAKIKIKGLNPSDFTWKSSKPSVAKVDSKGKIKAKSTGSSIITGTYEGCKVGCVVTVTTKKRYNAIKIAKKIGGVYGKGVYSQARRMTRPYYDCSSLVWTAYKSNGCNFGVRRGWAPTAASEAYYLARHHKMKGKLSKSKMNKLYYQAGDVIFKTGAKNHRYRGIYHIEMITGYNFYGFDSKGKAIVLLTWANRIPEYTTEAFHENVSIVGRP